MLYDNKVIKMSSKKHLAIVTPQNLSMNSDRKAEHWWSLPDWADCA